MIVSLQQQKEKRFEKFVKEQRQKTRAYLLGRYSLTEEEYKDVFQESLILLWKNITEDKVESDNLGMSSSTYFIKICINKTMELLREKSRYVSMAFDVNPIDEFHDFQTKQVDHIISMDDYCEQSQEDKEALVRNIVQNLPSPCNELLWGYYGDGHSMKMLAEMFNYANENAVKVTKHRCCEKFRLKYSEMSKSLF